MKKTFTCFQPIDINKQNQQLRHYQNLQPMEAVHVGNMFNSKQCLDRLTEDFHMVSDPEEIFDEYRHGDSHRIIGHSNMKKLRKQTHTLNEIVNHLCHYFDMDEEQVRKRSKIYQQQKPHTKELKSLKFPVYFRDSVIDRYT